MHFGRFILKNSQWRRLKCTTLTKDTSFHNHREVCKTSEIETPRYKDAFHCQNAELSYLEKDVEDISAPLPEQ